MSVKKLSITNLNMEADSNGRVPFVLINLKQGTQEWLQWRRSGIGASDAPTIMNENRFKSPEKLLYEKMNNIDVEKNEKMRIGTELEPEARSIYEKTRKRAVKPICIQSIASPWLIASLDGMSDDFKYVVEIKCGKSAYYKACCGSVPDYYYGQLQHQLMITGLNEIDYWCYWPGEKGILQKVSRDTLYIDKLFSKEQEFQKRMQAA
jgi:putative phage-type endonuclease